MSTGARPLVVVETHPVQYHAPVYRAVQDKHGIPVTVIYGSDFSVAGYRDREFGATFSWDTDLLAGTETFFLSRIKDGGARSFEEVSSRGLMKALHQARGSAVLLTGYSPAFNRSAFLAAKMAGIPLLLRAETSDSAMQRNALKSALRDAFLRRLYTLCTRVLPIGSNSRNHYRRLGVPQDKMIAAPYCVNTTPFAAQESDRESLRPAMRRELDIADNDIAILFSGKLSVRKGVHILTAAVKRLPESIRKRIVLVFLGAGSEQDAIAAACEQMPAIRCRFAGFRNQKELSPFYHAADLLALPSIQSETWGLVVNEALHHGVPCVVSDAVGCAPDLIEEGQTGAVAESGDADGLAAAIMRVIELTGNSSVRLNCRTKVAAFSSEAAAAGIALAWREATVKGFFA